MATDTETAAPEKEEQSEEEFRDEQRALAEAQGVTGEHAVPERRPIASQQVDSPSSELTQRLEEANDLHVGGTEAMGKDAYDRAESDSQRKKAGKDERQERIFKGDVVLVSDEDSPHHGRYVAVTRIVELRDNEQRLRNAMGDPTQQLDMPQVIEGRARGDDRDGEILILDVDEHGLEKVRDWRGTGRG